MSTLILALVCIILVFILYVVSGGWRKYGGLLGVFKWLRMGANMGPTISSRRASIQRDSPRTPLASSSAEEEAVHVLREIYEEFDQRHMALLLRVQELERQNVVLRDTLTNLERNPVSFTQPVPNDIQVTIEAADEIPVEPLGQSDSLERANPPQPISDNSSALLMDRQDRYFAILDLLDSGHSQEQIAAMLAVSEQDVAYVRRIMAGPL